MNNALDTINRVSSWIPSKLRGVIYGLIGLFWLLEAIWDVIPDNDFGSKIVATVTLFGMLMAAGNTDLVPDNRPPVITDQQLEDARDAGESTLMTILIILAIIVLVALILGWIRF